MSQTGVLTDRNRHINIQNQAYEQTENSQKRIYIRKKSDNQKTVKQTETGCNTDRKSNQIDILQTEM